MKYFILILMLPVILFLTQCDEDIDDVMCTVGAVCDDGDADTYNDVYDADCNCIGVLNVFTDTRDGQMYNTVTIGTQTWLAENLNYAEAGNSWCYGSNLSNCDVYGRLYDWNTAITIAPDGWHLPSSAEWTTLMNFLGGEAVAGGKLKEVGTAHWAPPNTGATNESGFTGLPGGWYDGHSQDLREYGGFWSSTEAGGSQVLSRFLYHTGADSFEGMGQKTHARSVRCIRD